MKELAILKKQKASIGVYGERVEERYSGRVGKALITLKLSRP